MVQTIADGLIHFDHVTFAYPGAPGPALQAVSLDLPEGELILVIGASGSGKSTLLRCLNGLTPHFSGGDLRGAVRVAGFDPVSATPRVLSHHVGFVFQDPEAQFVMERVEDEIAFALENAAMPRQEMRVRVEETLDLLDLTPLRNRLLKTLSGGERQRVAIAAALALRPRILALDEPTSQLDPKSAEDVLNALVRLNADLGLTILLAEHRLERVLPFVDRILYLPEAGGPLLCDEPRTVLRQINLAPPLVKLGKALAWEPLPLTIKEGLRFSRPWLRDRATPVDQPKPQPVIPASRQPPYIEVRGLTVRYGAAEVVRGVDFAVRPGEIVALMGRNGAGKTTLLRSLVGLVKPQAGAIRVAGESIAGKAVADICRRVGYLPQDPNTLLFAETVRDEMLVTLRNHAEGRGFDVSSAERARGEQLLIVNGQLPIVDDHQPATEVGAGSSQFTIEDAASEGRGFDVSSAERARGDFADPDVLLARLGLTHKADAYPRDLSVGERQRVALAAITVTLPGALLLDEPTRGLDYTAKDELVRLLQGWRADGAAIVLVTHDVELAAALADRVVLMSQGQVIADGTPAAVLGASPLFAPQIARLFPETGWLTVEDVMVSG
jgi:energy-coupling factor transporter ATP-binding protein EcfA2